MTMMCTSVVFIVLLTNVLCFGVDGGPKITGDKLTSSKTEQIIEAGEDLQLTCENDSPINWTIPSSVEIDRVKITERIEDHSKHRYISNLQIAQASAYHTGYYRCSERENDGEDEVYVYVKNASYPFANREGLVFLNVHQYGTVVFDCRPNSLDIEVKLSNGNGDLLSEGKNEEDGTELEYDPKIGFTMKNVNSKMVGLYSCEAGDEELLFLINILLHSDSISKPTIVSKHGFHPEVGVNITLTCSVEVNYSTPFSIDWDIPQFSRAHEENRTILGTSFLAIDSKAGSSTRIGERNITILNISKEDEGTYTCRVEDHFNNKNNNSMHIKVHDVLYFGADGPKIIKKREQNESVHIIEEGENLLLICGNDSTIVWAVSDSEEIDRFKMTEMIKNHSRHHYISNLQIANVSDYHTGYYKCSEKENDREDEVYVYVRIHSDSISKPTIVSNHGSHPEVEDNITLTCSVAIDYGIAFSINWDIPQFSKANKENRTILGTPFLTTDTRPGSSMIIGNRNITILNISKEDEGGYTCRVEDHSKNKNNNTIHIKIQDVVWFDDDDVPKISGGKLTSSKREQIIEAGEDLQLTCENDSPINWTIPSGVEIDRVKITERIKDHCRHRYISTLQIANASAYHTGYYRCSEKEDVDHNDKVYVYVKSATYPFAKRDDLVFLKVPQYGTAVFDCRPNSPDIEVKLLTSFGDLLNVGKNEEDGTELEYDPKIGFTMKYVKAKQDGLYFCKAGDDQLLFLIRILFHSDFISKPTIVSNHGSHPEVEDNITLTCSVAVDYGISFSIDWDIPQFSKANEENRTILGTLVLTPDTRPGSSMRIGKRNITILNISKEDEGRYTCRVEDHSENKNNTTICIKIQDVKCFDDVDVPKITGDKLTSSKREQIIEAGEDLQLTCGNDSPINWTIPSGVEIDRVKITERIKNHCRHRYISTLQIANASAYHTGYYRCSAKGDDDRKDEVYVYVRSPRYPFANRADLVFLNVPQYGTAVFDCRPNSPNIEVKLLTYTGDSLNVGKNEEDGTELEYDPKIGFTMKYVNAKQDGLYYCEAEDKQLLFLMRILLDSDSISKPTIVSNHGSHPEVEDNITLTCSVAVDYGASFSMDWDIPHFSKANEENRTILGASTLTTVTRPGSSMRIGKRNITILNISKEDDGRYTCRVEDHSKNKNNNSIRVKVHDKNSSYIHFKIAQEETLINETVGRRVRWVVQLESHPNASLTWFTPDNKPISVGKTDKYDVYIGKSSTETKLEINDIKFHDQGIYKLQAINDRLVEVANFTLIVNGPPIVELQVRKSYSLGESATINCTVEGYPPSDIRWYFKPCLSDCDYMLLPAKNYDNKTDEDGNMRSTLTMQANISGQLMCLANNSFGAVNETTRFLISGTWLSGATLTNFTVADFL